jgi:hypothetical protein
MVFLHLFKGEARRGLQIVDTYAFSKGGLFHTSPTNIQPLHTENFFILSLATFSSRTTHHNQGK